MIRRGLVIAAATAGLVMVSVPAQAGYACPPGNFDDRAATSVEISADCFRPAVARVGVGQELTFENLDSHDHTVGGVAGIFGDGHAPVHAGQSVAYRFDEEGVYPFFCVIHPGMAGAVVVGDGTPSDAAGAVAAPVEPASTAKDAAPPSAGLPPAMVVAIGVAGLLAGGVVTTLALRRRRALAAPA